MALIGMPEAAQRAGMTRSSIKRGLVNVGVPVVQINQKAFAVEETDLAAFIEKRGHSPGPGRPRKTERPGAG